ncbi:MAG: toluene tolerance protein [Thermodesulfobacteriota bacterium]|nr:toluene tolerance protein [Thermodesulfobacteriota bacterium]
MMEKVSAEAYAELIRSCKVLERDGYGEKVLLSDDGLIIKIFRLKRLFSGALLFPYARRFAANAKRLQQRNITSISVLKLGHCQQPKRDLVWYQPIAGETLRDYCRSHGIESLVETLAQFVAELHHKGILFRSLHWGNIIVADDLSLGLIDIADMRFYAKPLTLTQRQRNFHHMLRYAEDRTFFHQVADEFWSCYQTADNLSAAQCQQLHIKVS